MEILLSKESKYLASLFCNMNVIRRIVFKHESGCLTADIIKHRSGEPIDTGSRGGNMKHVFSD